MPRKTRKALLAYAVETRRGASAYHLLRPSKRLSPSVNHGPSRPKKKLRIDELEALQYAAIEKDYHLAIRIFKTYEVAYFCYYCTKRDRTATGMSTCISCWPCNIFAGSVFEMKDLHLSVSVVQVKQKLDTIQKHIPGFKASDYSIYKFFQRNHFTLRANTLLSQMLPANLEGKIIACLQKIQEEGSIGRFPYTLISNGWDPSTRYLGPNKSIDRLGANSCIIRTTGAEKRYITVVLSLWLNFSTNGYFWVKRKPEAQDTWENSCACSWTHVAPLRAADQLGLPYSNSLLTLDNFCVQTSEKIEKKMNDKSITHCVIPGGFISKLQPLDGFVNKQALQTDIERMLVWNHLWICLWICWQSRKIKNTSNSKYQTGWWRHERWWKKKASWSPNLFRCMELLGWILLFEMMLSWREHLKHYSNSSTVKSKRVKWQWTGWWSLCWHWTWGIKK